LANSTIAKITPPNSVTRKYKSVTLANSLILPLRSNLKVPIPKDFMEFINLSNMPVMRAMVPPDTPGIILAKPTAIPLSK